MDEGRNLGAFTNTHGSGRAIDEAPTKQSTGLLRPFGLVSTSEQMTRILRKDWWKCVSCDQNGCHATLTKRQEGRRI